MLTERASDGLARHDELAGVRVTVRRRDDDGIAPFATRASERVEPCHVTDDRFEQQVDETAAALAEARTEREPVQRAALSVANELVARNRDRLVLEMAAADRAVDAVGRDDHLRAGLSRRRALGGCDGDDHRGLPSVTQLHKRVEPIAHLRLHHAGTAAFAAAVTFARRVASSLIDMRIASAVAGASSFGDSA